jgi:drug/metabolite transporter (DMT)-like permease
MALKVIIISAMSSTLHHKVEFESAGGSFLAYYVAVPQTVAQPHHHPVLGVLLKLTSVVLLSGLAACVKYLGTAIPVGETIFVRGLISVIVLSGIAWRTAGLHLLKAKSWRSHALRSLSGTVAMFCWFFALTLLPFADLTAMTFTAPMFLTVLAMVFLGERIHRYRWTALIIGFIGVLITIGPLLSFGGDRTLGVAIALGGAVFSALALMFLRSMSGGGREHAITITFYFSLTSMAFAAFTALGGWPMPTAQQWLIIVLAGIFGVLGQLLMTLSYRYAEASTIAPLEYTSLLMALGFGYFVFGETPRLSTWIGAPLIITAGLIILWREYRRYAAASVPVVPDT